MRKFAWLSLVAGIVLLLLLGIVLFRQTVAVNKSIDSMHNKFDPAAAQTAVLAISISDMQRGVSNFLLTGDEAALDPYLDGASRSELALQQLTALLAPYDQLSALTDATVDSRQAWIDQVAGPTIDQARAGEMELALALYTRPEASQLFLALQSDAAYLASGIADSGNEAFGDLSSLTYRLIATVGVTVLLLVALLVAGFVILTRLVVRPIEDLRLQIRTVASGRDHTQTIQPAGSVELRAVGLDVEELRRHLVAEIDEARSAREALEQDAPVVSAIRRELAAGTAVSVPGLSIFGDLHPAEGIIAGDWWASALLHTGEAAVILADISGHGAEAGVAAMQLKHAIQHDLLGGVDIGEMAVSAAEMFRTQSDRFATVAAVCVDPATGKVRYINAGHPEPLLLDEFGEVVEGLARTGPMLSWLGGEWRIGQTELPPDHTILIYSDGLVEARDSQGVELGESMLRNWLLEVPDDQRDPAALIAWLIGAARHRAEDWNRDDITLVAIRRGPGPAAERNLVAHRIAGVTGRFRTA